MVRHRLVAAIDAQAERMLERELSWAVIARATVPMLPLLRGGELVILPSRVLGRFRTLSSDPAARTGGARCRREWCLTRR